MQSETKPFIFPKAAPGGFSGEERLGWRQFGLGSIGYWGTGAETVESIQDGEGSGEAGGQILEPQEVTLKDLYDAFIELSETNNHTRDQISALHCSELLSDCKNLLSSGTANPPETSDVDEGDEDEEQGSDDENDLLVRFGSLGKQLKTFQRDLTRADKRVESAKKVSSPLRKKRKKRR